MEIIVNFDGASRGNPGNASCAYIIRTNDKTIKKSFFLNTMTNNQAEYYGLIKALENLLELGIDRKNKIKIFSDSELVVKQIKGQYKVKNEKLKELYSKAMIMMNKFDSINIEHVKREFNKEADHLANKELDNH